MDKKLDGLTFPVSKVAVMDVMGPDIAKVKKGITHAIVRDDTQEILSFVSEDYHLIPNADIITQFEEFFKAKGIKYEMTTSAYNDVRFKISFALTDYMEPIQEGDLVFPQFYIANSYNRSQKYLFGMSVLREVCSNGLTAWVTENVVNMLHTPGSGIAVAESLKLIQDFLPAFDETLDPYYELTEREFDSFAELELRVDEVIENTGFPVGLGNDAKAQAVIEIDKHKYLPSDWMVYNSLNFQLNHNAENLLGRKADRIDREVLGYLLNS